MSALCFLFETVFEKPIARRHPKGPNKPDTFGIVAKS